MIGVCCRQHHITQWEARASLCACMHASMRESEQSITALQHAHIPLAFRDDGPVWRGNAMLEPLEVIDLIPIIRILVQLRGLQNTRICKFALED